MIFEQQIGIFLRFPVLPSVFWRPTDEKKFKMT